MFFLKIIKDIIGILREGQTPAQVAGGFALGSVLGLSPMFTLQGFLVWIVLLTLDVNLGAAFLAITFCSLFAYLADPFFHWFGFTMLTSVPVLKDLWTWMYNAPITPLTRFNNTVVMGSFVSSAVLFIPTYVGMKRLIVAYRKNIGSKVEKWKVFQILKKSSLVRWYERVRDIGG